MKKILLTGGAGFIGSHTCIELLKSGFEIVILDSFFNKSSFFLRNKFIKYKFKRFKGRYKGS